VKSHSVLGHGPRQLGEEIRLSIGSIQTKIKPNSLPAMAQHCKEAEFILLSSARHNYSSKSKNKVHDLFTHKM
jgi:hypothetical protein